MSTLANCESNALQWTDLATMAFENIKQALSKATLLFHPKQDARTSIMTDASSQAVGAILQQYILMVSGAQSDTSPRS